MLPVIDYGGIAIVIPHVVAVGSAVEDNQRYGFEVFFAGMEDPMLVGFDSMIEAEQARKDLVSIVAEYHLVTTLGPDFDFEEMFGIDDDDVDDGTDTH